MSAGQKYLFPIPTAGEIALAAKTTIEAVRADKGLGDKEFANLIGQKDEGVIERLVRLETKKVPASLFSAVAAAYGDSYIQGYMQLMGLKAVPRNQEQAINALPALTALAAKLAAAATATGGINHQSLAGMLSELRDADGVISTLRARAADLGMAA